MQQNTTSNTFACHLVLCSSSSFITASLKLISLVNFSFAVHDSLQFPWQSWDWLYKQAEGGGQNSWRSFGTRLEMLGIFYPYQSLDLPTPWKNVTCSVWGSTTLESQFRSLLHHWTMSISLVNILSVATCPFYHVNEKKVVLEKTG